MADKKKNRRKFDEDEKPTKEDYAVAKFLRSNVPTREAKLHSMDVHCFFASAAVDALLESKWSASKNAKEPLFFNRSSCVNFCQRLIEKGLFHRAEKVQRKKEKADRSKKKKGKDTAEKDGGGTGDELRERKSKKDKKEEEADPEKTTACESEETKEEKKNEETKEEKKDEKKKKPIKLVMTEDQRFLDGEENIYVWIYDPVSAKTLFIGSLIVFGAVALCLFPLWPEVVRVGVYYVSLTGAGFVGFILSLVVVRFILFCAIWLLTLGRHHFWLLPNLTEDVGFFESFRPLYKHEVIVRDPSEKTTAKSKSETKEKSKKQDKGSDGDDSGSEQEFEMIEKGDIEEEDREKPGDEMKGEEEEEDAESEENAEEREEMEEEEYGPEEEEEEDEDYEEEEEEDGPNDGLEEDYVEKEEDVEEEGDASEPKKDK